ncbi:MAG: hypothetical protein K2G88_05595 [Oscillospiraceae bacterium]|nr:hypothetical protein [Oscillospiraceae bacterium]MDE6004843.1 hypothetical protein [Oscillospiraceae bacterium]MDE6658186.1 hypothetical protein [Oscillospiraceae bacterium]
MNNFMMYKGYPLVRKDNELYYGYMSEPYVVFLRIEKTQKEYGIMTAKKIEFYQMSTNLDKPEIKQRAERENLYEALDVASEWLSRSKS